MKVVKHKGMDDMTYQKIMQQINKGNIAQTYLLYGTEAYFIEKVKQKITEQLIPEIGDELAIYDLEQTPIQEVIADAETIPFLNDKKLIIAHNPTFLLARQSRLPFTHDLKPLESYLENPPAYTTIIFIAPYERIDNRKKITKLMKKATTDFFSEPIHEREMGNWINQIGEQYKIRFTHDARLIIESELSANLSILHNEIEKIALYVGENNEVTKEVVIELLSRTSEMSVLQLVDAVLERNLYQAITIYKTLEKMNEEPIAMIALLAYQFRVMLQVKLLREKGQTESNITRQLKVHPYVVKLANRRSRHFSVRRLEQIIEMFAEADTMIKRGLMEKGIAFELLLYNLIEN